MKRICIAVACVLAVSGCTSTPPDSRRALVGDEAILPTAVKALYYDEAGDVVGEETLLTPTLKNARAYATLLELKRPPCAPKPPWRDCKQGGAPMCCKP